MGTCLALRKVTLWARWHCLHCSFSHMLKCIRTLPARNLQSEFVSFSQGSALANLPTPLPDTLCTGPRAPCQHRLGHPNLAGAMWRLNPRLLLQPLLLAGFPVCAWDLYRRQHCLWSSLWSFLLDVTSVQRCHTRPVSRSQHPSLGPQWARPDIWLMSQLGHCQPSSPVYWVWLEC